jgi:hypothetical protein
MSTQFLPLAFFCVRASLTCEYVLLSTRAFSSVPLILKIVATPNCDNSPRPDSDLDHSYLYLLCARANKRHQLY